MDDTIQLKNSFTAEQLLKQVEDTQSFLLGYSWAGSGKNFFELLAVYLYESLGADYVCIDKLIPGGLEAQTVAVYFDGQFEDNVRYTLEDTPCGKVSGQQVCCFPHKVRHLFPNDVVLQEMVAESYSGITLWSSEGIPIGLIAVISRKPLTDTKLAEIVLKQVSIRAASELEHNFAEENLRKNQENHKVIIESAMDGFWLTDKQGNFLEVNEAYCNMSGYSKEELLKMKISDIESIESYEETVSRIEKIIKIGEDRFESVHQRKNGSYFIVEISAKYHNVNGGQFVTFLHDITNRKNSERLIKESEVRYKSIFMNGKSIMILINPDSAEIFDVNQAACDFYGYSYLDFCGKNLTDLNFLTKEHTISNLQKTKLGIQNKFQYKHRLASGETREVEIFSSPLQFNESIVLFAIIHDITERIELEEALLKLNTELDERIKDRTLELTISNKNLKEAEEKYRTVADFTYNMETWMDTNGKYIYVSPSCFKITGYTAEEFMNDSNLFVKIAHPDDREMVENHFKADMTGTVLKGALEFRIITKSGDERWIGHSCQPVFNTEGKLLGQRGSNRNITKQKTAEFILIESEKNLRALTQRMDEVAEEERIRISREIHDEIGHLLTALKYDTEGLINHPSYSQEQIKEELTGMISMIEALIDSVRKIATELRPGILDHMGLLAAIEWKIKQFRLKNKICCIYDIQDLDINFTKNVTTFIFRILQEIFTNIIRHSNATHMWISITYKNSSFELKVIDNGIGFDVESSLQKGSLGLIGMIERAKSIGGEIKIVSESGKGTTTSFLLQK